MRSVKNEIIGGDVGVGQTARGNVGETSTTYGSPRGLLSTRELAKALGVDQSTVRVWLRVGLIRADARTLGGHARFLPETVAALVAAQRARAA